MTVILEGGSDGFSRCLPIDVSRNVIGLDNPRQRGDKKRHLRPGTQPPASITERPGPARPPAGKRGVTPTKPSLAKGLKKTPERTIMAAARERAWLARLSLNAPRRPAGRH